MLTFGESVDKTLVELNKALSLAGLTVLCLAFCLPSFAVETAKEEVFLQTQLCWHAVTMLVVHSIFSLVKVGFKRTSTRPLPDHLLLPAD